MPDPIRLIDLDDLVGRREIAERARIKVVTVDTWRRRYPTFPMPIGEISGTPLWSWQEVHTWIVETPREVGRPAADTSMIARTPLPARLSRAIRTAPPIEQGPAPITKLNETAS